MICNLIIIYYLRYLLLFETLRKTLSFPLQNRKYSYIDRGFYARSIKRMLVFFLIEQMHFLKTEDLLNYHQLTLNEFFNFLNLPEFNSIESKLFFLIYLRFVILKYRIIY